MKPTLAEQFAHELRMRPWLFEGIGHVKVWINRFATLTDLTQDEATTLVFHSIGKVIGIPPRRLGGIKIRYMVEGEITWLST